MPDPLTKMVRHSSVRLRPLILEYLDTRTGPAARKRLSGEIVQEVEREIRLFDDIIAVAGETALDGELKSQIIEGAYAQKERLSQVANRAVSEPSGHAGRSIAVPRMLCLAVEAISQRAAVPHLQRLAGHADVEGRQACDTSSESVSVQLLLRLGDALASYEWKNVSRELHEACLDEFGGLYCQEMIRGARESLESGDTADLNAGVRRYMGWNLPPLEDQSSVELAQILVSLAVRDARSRSLFWLDFARRLRGRSEEQRKVATIEDDLAAASATTKRIEHMAHATDDERDTSPRDTGDEDQA